MIANEGLILFSKLVLVWRQFSPGLLELLTSKNFNIQSPGGGCDPGVHQIIYLSSKSFYSHRPQY